MKGSTFEMKLTIFKSLVLGSAIFLVACGSRETHEFQGYVDGDLTFIASHFEGNLEILHVQEGDTVQKNQPLIQLDLEPQQSQYQQANYQLQSAIKNLDNLKKGERKTVLAGIEAEIAKAKSEIELAKARLERLKTLYEKKLADKDALEQVTTDYNTKKDNLNQLNARLEEARLGGREDVIAAQEALVNAAQARVDELAWAIDSKKLFAPAEGYIYDIFYWQGEFVPGSKPILSMLTPDHQYIIFFIPIKIMAKVKVGQQVSVDCEGCKKPYEAKITYISPKVEYTPPVIFSRQHQDKYVYRLHAKLSHEDVLNFHLGQPVYVTLKQG